MTQATPPIRVAIVGLEHAHALGVALVLDAAGADIVAFSNERSGPGESAIRSADGRAPGDVDLSGPDHQQADGMAGGHNWEPDFRALFPDARAYQNLDELLAGDTFDLAVPVGVPDERAGHAIAALAAGKSVLADKPIAISPDQLRQLREATTTAEDQGAMFGVWFSERFESRATTRATELVADGAIGDLVEVIGLGPHRLAAGSRPEWFFDATRAGTLLTDLMTHQVEQFLHLAAVAGHDPADATIVHAHQAHHPTGHRVSTELRNAESATPRTVTEAARPLPNHATLDLAVGPVTGHLRVDWLSPEGLHTWGDVRLMLLGTTGTIEVRKNVDLGSHHQGGDHLLLTDQSGVHRIDCSEVVLPFATELLEAVGGATNQFTNPETTLRVLDLCLRAEQQAAS